MNLAYNTCPKWPGLRWTQIKWQESSYEASFIQKKRNLNKIMALPIPEKLDKNYNNEKVLKYIPKFAEKEQIFK